MDLEINSFLPKKFEGWNPRTIYKLGDGTKWRLAKPKSTQVKRNQPRVKIWKDNERFFMEIVGLNDKVEVSQVM